jgi:hypothetical protein
MIKYVLTFRFDLLIDVQDMLIAAKQTSNLLYLYYRAAISRSLITNAWYMNFQI